MARWTAAVQVTTTSRTASAVGHERARPFRLPSANMRACSFYAAAFRPDSDLAQPAGTSQPSLLHLIDNEQQLTAHEIELASHE
jgi:hypothetical protein